MKPNITFRVPKEVERRRVLGGGGGEHDYSLYRNNVKVEQHIEYRKGGREEACLCSWESAVTVHAEATPY